MSIKTDIKNKALPESISISSSFETKAQSMKNYEITPSKQSLNRKSIQQQEQTKKSEQPVITDLALLLILNKFVFCLFFLFIVFLNIFSLFVFPYIIQTPLSIDS